jgi:hypothetical protein
VLVDLVSTRVALQKSTIRELSRVRLGATAAVAGKVIFAIGPVVSAGQQQTLDHRNLVDEANRCSSICWADGHDFLVDQGRKVTSSQW